MAVVVVSWNSAAVIDACLRSAVAAQPAEIIVVDNNSADATARRVRTHAGARLIPLATNTGFAHACNVGVACSSAPFVLFLNDDACITPTYLRLLVAALRANPQAASAIGKLLRPAMASPAALPVIDSAGIVLDRYALRPLDRGHGELDRGQYDAAEEVFGGSGAAVVYRREAFAGLPRCDAERSAQATLYGLSAAAADQDAPFDAAFFAYYEDVDLAWRLKNRGWSHLYVPQAIATHGRRGPASKPGPIARRAYVNRYRTWLKNEPLLRFVSYAPVALAWEAARLARRCLPRRGLFP